MLIRYVWEHNDKDSLIYADNFPGAFVRGQTKEIALSKMEAEIKSYLMWCSQPIPDSFDIEIIQEKVSDLNIADADSDVLFETEKHPLTLMEYHTLKERAMKSACDFQALYDSIPNKDTSSNLQRTTFYGNVPRTANEMYVHTKNINSYYFGEINVNADNEGNIIECRKRGFDALEQTPDFLNNPVFAGSYGEEWTLRKVLRRFIWHDRIHAKAMLRMAQRTFQHNKIYDTFHFNLKENL